MNLIFYIFIAILALSVIVFFHELGHFLAARFFGVKVERFSIGFGKVLFKKHFAGTEWAFAPILLGGYVKLKGQDDLNPLARSNDPDSYNSKKPWQRIIILAAGPIANFVLAFFIYFALALKGAPVSIASNYLPPIIGELAKNSPAKKLLQKKDKILFINGQKIRYWYEIGQVIKNTKEPIKLTILRNGKKLELTLKPKTITAKNQFNETIKRKIIGILPLVKPHQIIHFNFLQALKYAYIETKNAALLIFKGVEKISTGKVDSKNIGGAITIFDLIIKFSKLGISYLLFIMALISVNLGVLNLLPIPALDGGHIMFNLYELITQRAPSQKVYYALTMFGWAFLIFLMAFGMYNDINRIWGGK